MDSISQIGNQMNADTQNAIQQRIQKPGAMQVRQDVQHAQAAPTSRRAEEASDAEHARQRQSASAPNKTGGRLDTYA